MLRGAERSCVKGDRADGACGTLVPERNEAAATPFLKGHRRNNRHSETRAHHTQDAAELAAFKNDLWLKPSAFARRHSRFAEAMTITEQEKRIVVSLGELHGDPFLLLRDGHCFRETAVAACKRARLQPKIVFESGQFSSILSMVSAGLGVSIIPAMALEKRRGCCFVALGDERAARTIGSVTLNGRSLSRAQDAFLAHLAPQPPTNHPQPTHPHYPNNKPT